MALNGKDRITNIEQSGTNAERLGLDTSLVKQATEFYETDTTARYKFMSGAWVLATASGGLIPGASPGSQFPVSSGANNYTNGVLTSQVETSAATGKTRTTTYTYTNGVLTNTVYGGWV